MSSQFWPFTDVLREIWPAVTRKVVWLCDGGKNMKIDGKEKNVLPVSTTEYNRCGWRSWLNGITITLGMQNVFDEDPPFVAGAG